MQIAIMLKNHNRLKVSTYWYSKS